jgi:hypothetical protein
MKFIPLTLSLLFISLSFELFATNAQPILDSSQRALVFSHQYRAAKKYLTFGERVKIRLKNQSHFNRGKIIQITDSTLIIERNKQTKTIQLNEIELIQKTTIGNIIASIYGGSAIFNGAVLSIAGVSELTRLGNDGWSGLILPFLLLFTLIGFCLVFVGTLPFWARAKRFNLGKQIWKMEVKNIYRDKYGKVKGL